MGNDETPDPEAEILKRTVDTTEMQANYRVLEVIAEVEDVDVTTLPPMYERINHMLDELFSTPPEPEAQMEVTFSYHGYRVTVNQNGTVTLRKLDSSAEPIE